jgi:hypothetical protein
MTKNSKRAAGSRHRETVIIRQFPINKYARPIIILPIPNDIYKAIDYFCLKEFSTVSPIMVIVILMDVYEPKPVKNRPTYAIHMFSAPLKIAIPSTVIDQAKTIENLRPKLSVK